MTCRSCGATIADKAIVCYKCGAPTAEAPSPVRRTSPGKRFPLLLAVAVVMTGLAAWLIPMTPEGTWMRWTAWAAVPIVTFLSVRLIRTATF